MANKEFFEGLSEDDQRAVRTRPPSGFDHIVEYQESLRGGCSPRSRRPSRKWRSSCPPTSSAPFQDAGDRGRGQVRRHDRRQRQGDPRAVEAGRRRRQGLTFQDGRVIAGLVRPAAGGPPTDRTGQWRDAAGGMTRRRGIAPSSRWRCSTRAIAGSRVMLAAGVLLMAANTIGQRHRPLRVPAEHLLLGGAEPVPHRADHLRRDQLRRAARPAYPDDGDLRRAAGRRPQGDDDGHRIVTGDHAGLAWYSYGYVGTVASQGRVLPALQVPIWGAYVWVPRRLLHHRHPVRADRDQEHHGPRRLPLDHRARRLRRRRAGI